MNATLLCKLRRRNTERGFWLTGDINNTIRLSIVESPDGAGNVYDAILLPIDTGEPPRADGRRADAPKGELIGHILSVMDTNHE
jgi:hypothetical protein